MSTLDTPEPPGTPGGVLALIRSGRATSRAEIARRADLSASTASERVERLIEHGYIQEVDATGPRRGRRPRHLAVAAGLGHVAVIDLGLSYATIAVSDMSGVLEKHIQVPVDLEDGPQKVLGHLLRETLALAKTVTNKSLMALCIGVPGPVEPYRGVVISPSRMPGWNGANLPSIVQQFVEVPVVVENDANLLALGEYGLSGSKTRNMVLLQAGVGIGCGIIASGELFRGSWGVAGDISHTTVPDAEPIPCSCGRTGCLDAVASGSGLMNSLSAHGVEVRGTEDLLRVASHADPVATTLLREAGSRTGVVLATVVSFFNPDLLVLGGPLSRTDAFVAGVHSAIYASSLPMTTDNLEITISRDRPQAALHSGIGRAIDQVLSPGAVNADLNARTRRP